MRNSVIILVVLLGSSVALAETPSKRTQIEQEIERVRSLQTSEERDLQSSQLLSQISAMQRTNHQVLNSGQPMTVGLGRAVAIRQAQIDAGLKRLQELSQAPVTSESERASKLSSLTQSLAEVASCGSLLLSGLVN